MSKIDRLIGERVLGLTPWREDRAGTSYVVWTAGDVKPWSIFRVESHERESKRYTKITAKDVDPHNDIDCGAATMRYSVDLGIAWKVWGNPHVVRHVEYLAPSVDEDTGKVLHWVSAVNINGVRRGRTSVNPAMALCEAALRAVGVSESEIQEALT